MLPIRQHGDTPALFFFLPAFPHDCSSLVACLCNCLNSLVNVWTKDDLHSLLPLSPFPFDVPHFILHLFIFDTT